MRVVLASLCLLLVQPVSPEPAVTGYVLAPDDTPVSSGTVLARLGFTAVSASIERSGRFRLLLPRPGPYAFVVTVPGLAPYRLSVTVPRSLRLPLIRLSAGEYFRVRLVTPTGEPIVIPLVRRRVLDARGNPIVETPTERPTDPADADGVVTFGPLPRGTFTAAVDMPLLAQTRLPDMAIGEEARTLDGGTIVIEQPGAVLDVDLVDEAGAPVANQYVFLEDARPRSPLVFHPVETDLHGRATFERLAAGRYRVQSSAVARCANVRLRTSRDVPVPGSGRVGMRLVIGGRATFHIGSALGPVRGATIAAEPDVPGSAPPRDRPTASACVGSTDSDGRATLPNFPPGPARIDIRLANSTYGRRIDVPTDGREIAIDVPDGFLPVRVVSAATNQAIAGAAVTWTGSGGRAEATTTAAGEALLEGVGAGPGALVASARGYQDTAEQLTEPPGVPHTIAMTPVPPPSHVTVRVATSAGDPLANAVVELISRGAEPRVAVAGPNGVVVFDGGTSASAEVIATADGFVRSTARVGSLASPDILLTLARGYRVNAAVELPFSAGPQRVRVMNEASRSMEDWLDIDSDRAVDVPSRLSLGPLVAGAYVVELSGAAGVRQQRVRIVDRDAFVTFR